MIMMVSFCSFNEFHLFVVINMKFLQHDNDRLMMAGEKFFFLVVVVVANISCPIFFPTRHFFQAKWLMCICVCVCGDNNIFNRCTNILHI